ncbi:MAG: hypothetical protein NTU83_07760 [Candidatus Hydrogenedentes bacterium]|nr:hypothetical protein [Candidatus Hydrogenedentota bacterium]
MRPRDGERTRVREHPERLDRFEEIEHVLRAVHVDPHRDVTCYGQIV